jgi:hypothetical protein
MSKKDQIFYLTNQTKKKGVIEAIQRQSKQKQINHDIHFPMPKKKERKLDKIKTVE